MNVEENRLRTFADWPANAAVDAARIAKAGFYYSGHSLEVQCFLCGTKISEWNYGDQAMVRHRRAEPNCPFVQNPNSTCNVPLIPLSRNNIGPMSSSNTSSSSTSSSTSSSSTDIQRSNSETANLPTTSSVQNNDTRSKYRSLSQRLRSFANWSIPSVVSPEKLAKAGFYYIQYDDVVECVFCGGIVSKWKPGDDPDKEHRIHFPKCDFYLYQEEDDKMGLSNVKIVEGNATDLTELGIHAHTAPRMPKHATYEGRLRTFHGWPTHLKQTPEMLASAGFYYDGFDDHVTCFYCNGGLHNWEATDDAWTEHARWFPKCGFVNLIRGQEFIKRCIDNRPPLDPSIFAGVPEDENTDIAEKSTASISSISVPDQEVTEENPVTSLNSPATAAAPVQAGLPTSRLADALKKRMKESNVPYEYSNQLLKSILREQVMETGTSLNNEATVLRSSEANNLPNSVKNGETNNSIKQCTNVKEDDARSSVNRDKESQQSPNNEKVSEVSKEEDNTIEMKINDKTRESAFLEEENRRLREARLCKICMDKEVAIVFLPCGHLASCVHCVPSLTYCPMCRQEIRATVRTFLS